MEYWNTVWLKAPAKYRIPANIALLHSTQSNQERTRAGPAPSAAVAVYWGDGVCPGGVCPGGTYLPGRGCLPRWGGVSAQGVGCLPSGGVCPGDVSSQGVSAWECVSQHPLGKTPPLVDRMTDRCKNITFPQLRLRTVKSTLYMLMRLLLSTS